MGTTLWVLSKSKVKDGDDWDHSALFNAMEKLDPVCEHLGLVKLSSFLDWTDFDANMSEDDEFPSEETMRSKETWFAPSEALPILRALHQLFISSESERKSLFSEGYQYLADDLIEELDDCISKIEKIDTKGDLFHFCVVM